MSVDATTAPVSTASVSPAPANDAVNHPSHYTRFSVEIIEVTSQLSFCLGNAVKYIARAGAKDDSKEVEDLRKARFYLARELDDFRQCRAVATAPVGVLAKSEILREEIGGDRGILVHGICLAAASSGLVIGQSLISIIELLDEQLAELGYVDAATGR
ncbi:MAG: DUF3310 domain-containing protein [Nakamurella sp.]